MKPKTLALSGALCAFALVCGYVEFLIPLPLPLGAKLGLSNIVTVFALYTLSARSAAVILAVRIALSALLFGTLFALLYSAVGGALAFAAMALLRKNPHLSPVGVSVTGAVCHNSGQLVVACILLGAPGALLYLPTLLLCGTLCGFLTGVLASAVIKRLKK